MRATVRRTALVAVVAVASLSAVSASADGEAATRLTVSGVDTVGFPYVDLILSGVPGLGVGDPPPITVTQAGQPVRATTSWALAPSQPLAVIMDAPTSDRAAAQGIIGELVQQLPPDLPLTLVSTVSARAVNTGTNRNDFMGRLGRLPARTSLPVSAGVKSAAAAGIQHVFALTTCTSPPPAASPVGIVVDVLAVGPGCTNSWKAALASGAGGYITAGDLASGLAALDALVAQWQSSVVVVAQASSRDPIVLGTGGDRVTAPLDAALAAAPSEAAPSPSAVAPTAQPAPAASSDASGSTGLVLVLGVLLLALAALLALVWARRRRRGPSAVPAIAPAIVPAIAPDREPAPAPVSRAVTGDIAPVEQEALPLAVVSPDVEPVEQEALPLAVVSVDVEPVEQEALPLAVVTADVEPVEQESLPVALVELPEQMVPVQGAPRTFSVGFGDLRTPNGNGNGHSNGHGNGHGQVAATGQNGRPASGQRPEQTPHDLVIDLRDEAELVADVRLVSAEPADVPLMAVATPEAVREAEPSQPAAVAERDDFEEPVAMAEEQPAAEVRTDEVAANVATDDVATDGVAADEEPTVIDLTDASEEPDELEESDQPVAGAAAIADAPDAAVVAEAAEAAEGELPDQSEPDQSEPDQPPAMPKMGEFSWTPITFTPLVWRYDAEPEEPSAIDLREPAAVDVREKSDRKAPRRKKARR